MPIIEGIQMANNAAPVAPPFVQGTRTSVLADRDVHPDGTSPSGEGMQRVLTTVGQTGGGCVEVPPGTYLMDRVLHIPSNVMFSGVGYASALVLAPGMPGLVHMVTNTDHDGGNANITIRDLRLNGNRPNQSAPDATHNGIWLQNVTGAVVSHCFVEEIHSANFTYGAGIICHGGRDIVIANNVVRRARRLGIGTTEGPYNVAINGNTARECGEEGIHCSTGSGITVTGNASERNAWQGINMTNSIRSVCTGNSCNHNGADGILALGGECTINGNSCSANGRFGILLQSANVQRVVSRVAVTGNYVTDNSQHAIAAQRISNVAITGNVISVLGGWNAIDISAPLNGQQTVTSEWFAPQSIAVTGNVVHGSATHFVAIAAGYEDVLIAGNVHRGAIAVGGPPARYLEANNLRVP
jgi:hypothetical protein